MATIQRFPLVTLNEKDVPGARLPFTDVSQNTAVALRRWLETRGLSMRGRKAELVQRVESCLSADLPIDVKLDSGKWYELAVQSLTDANPPVPSAQPPVPPVTGWAVFPSTKIPKYFNKGQIFHYIVESATFADSTVDMPVDIKTEKPLKRGKQFFESGHVQDMEDCCVCSSSAGELYYLKSIVRASFDDAQYNVLAAIDMRTGFVRDASCNCKASAMGRCSHVAALLLALADYMEKYGADGSDAACTSKPCEWNKGRKTYRSPKKLQDCHSKEGKKFITITFDPRPQGSRETSETIREQFKKCVTSAVEKGKLTSGWDFICADKDIQSDYEVDDSRKEVLRKNREQFISGLLSANATDPLTTKPVEIVREQGSDRWRAERSVRVTASLCKSVKTAKSAQTKTNLVKKIMWSSHVSSKEMEYGKEMEVKGLDAYSSQADPLYKVESSGLWMNPKFPELACSPDSVVKTIQDNQIIGVVEVKCPFVLADHPIDDFDSVLTKSQLYNFCLKRTEAGNMRLKRNHTYYFQIQMQMGVMEVKWCDFLVWSKKSFFVERVSFDCAFWNALKSSLQSFHHRYLVPDYFEMKVPRGLPAAIVE